MELPKTWRKTDQPLLPSHREPLADDRYDVFPSSPIGSGKIHLGYDALAERLAGQRQVILDGFGGVFWSHLREQLDRGLLRRGIRTRWFNVEDALHTEDDLTQLVARFLGGDDPLFGTRFSGSLRDFFVPEKLSALRPDARAQLCIVYGCGAALAGWGGPLVYVDLPKNEIQYRSRAGSVRNLGASQPADPKVMYKQFYFVDWVALGRHKAELLRRIDLLVDGQRPDEPAMIGGADLRSALTQMGCNCFRARPWFEPGPWGGQWIKQQVPQLPQTPPNYAWSFELIAPENGLVLESDGRQLEVSFDLLMFHDHGAVLGDHAEPFGYEFPIRFDFLDTFDGGNLSVQCHPRPDYIRSHFGETFTQDETYYILDCKPGAHVYLGFNQSIDPNAFRSELVRSFQEHAAVDIEQFVHKVPAHRHDLFLIPSGTIHCSGANNLVLEISATPYIFTFKMYDWLRLDLEGKPRPLNIERAFDNLDFKRQGERVEKELISKPAVLREGVGWRLIHLPTHREHFYDVHRLEFTEQMEVTTDGSCQVMNLVEGTSVIVETAGGMSQRFHFAETFVVPANTGSFRLINGGKQPVKVVKAFIKKVGTAAK